MNKLLEETNQSFSVDNESLITNCLNQKVEYRKICNDICFDFEAYIEDVYTKRK